MSRRSGPSATALETAASIIENFNDAVVVVDQASRVLAMNPEAVRLFEVPEGQIPDRLDALVPASEAGTHHLKVADFAHSADATLTPMSGRTLLGRKADGREFPVVVSISRWEAPDGTTQFVAVIREDRRRRIDSAGAEWTRLLLTGLLTTSTTSILVVDQTLQTVAASESFRQHFLRGEDPTGAKLTELMATYRRPPNFDILYTGVQAVASNSPVRCTCGTGWTDDDRWFDVTATPLHPGSGAMIEATEITRLVQTARVLNADGDLDRTTNLLSRAGILDWIQHERLGAPAQQLCVTMLGVDQFEVVDEALGTAAGDELLGQVAEHIRSHLTRGVAAARTDRSTFCIAYPCASAAEADRRSTELRDAVRKPVLAKGRTLRLTASIGTSFTAQHSSSARAIREAEAAMAEARRRGGNRYAPYVPDEIELRDGVLRTWSALAEALQFRQLEVWFQPIIDLTTGRPFAAEALSRWHHPQLGEISPAEFIPLAEWGAEIDRLGAFVQDRAVETVLAIRSDLGTRIRDFQVSINVSGQELVSDHFAAAFLRRVQAAGARPEWFALEVDHDALNDTDPRPLEHLRALAAEGACITVGEFGSSTSSMERLLDIPVTRVKIPRRLIATMLQEERSARVVATTVAMVRELGIHVVAEGVETAEQLTELVRLGCTAAQGYRFAPAVPATELRDVLRDLSVAGR